MRKWRVIRESSDSIDFVKISAPRWGGMLLKCRRMKFLQPTVRFGDAIRFRIIDLFFFFHPFPPDVTVDVATVFSFFGFSEVARYLSSEQTR